MHANYGLIHHAHMHELFCVCVCVCACARVRACVHTPVSASNMFQDLLQLHETADNTKRYV